MVYGKITKGIPPLRRPKQSKKLQEKDDEIKKVYEANSHWNNWKLQLRCNKIEWVNKRSQIKIKQPYKVSSIYFIDKDLRTAHWIDHSLLKELYYNICFDRKHMIEYLEAELTGGQKKLQILTIRR